MRLMTPHQQPRRGFTLIELLVVVAIIGLLTSIAAVAFSRARAKPRNAKRVADIKAIQKGLELYYAQNGGYPSVAAVTALGSASAKNLCGTASWTASGTCSGTVYLQNVPSAPAPADGSCAANTPYNYLSSATSGFSPSYTITFCIGADVGDISAGTRTASPIGIQ